MLSEGRSEIDRYVRAAAAWLPYAERHWHPHLEREDAGYFGAGTAGRPAFSLRLALTLHERADAAPASEAGEISW